MSKTYIDRVKETRDILNEVGCGFCLMKWYKQTLYLHTGDNHSCYHPRPHHIPEKSIINNPSALHNTEQKKQMRKLMLENERPDECYYCWNVEDLEGEHYSDRMFHSSSFWLDAKEETEKIVKKLPWNANVNPKYLEISFGNGCNFKCGYCAPQASSLWVEEIEKHGNYDISFKQQYSTDFIRNGTYYKDNEDNPYVTAFWEWWPSLKKDLKVFRITGGEPLMNSNTFKLLDMLDEDPAPDLEININTNLGVTPRLVKKMAQKVHYLLEEGKIKDFKLYTSIDSWGETAEYMRRGLKVDVWEENLNHFMTINRNVSVSLMCTYNVLSVATFRPLLEKVLEWREKYNRDSTSDKQRLGFDTPYLKEPPHWMMNILPKEFGKYIDDDLKFIQDNLDEGDFNKFSEHEYEKLKRVRDYFYDGGAAITPEVIENGRRDFGKFFPEYDLRSMSIFEKTFPMYVDFLEECKKLQDK